MKHSILPVTSRLQEAYESVQKAMLDLFGQVRNPKNKRQFIPKVSVELVNDGISEAAILIDGWLYISEGGEEVAVKTIGRTIRRERPTFILTHATYNPGVRYYPDGSGEPPSTDYEGCEPDSTSSIVVAIQVMAKMIIDNRMELIAEYEMLRGQAEEEGF